MGSFKLFGTELKSLKERKGLLFALIGVMLIPIVYVAVLLSATWGPYDNLENLPVAFVNKDLGGVSSGQPINVGEDLVATLKESKTLGWNFVSDEEAQKGLKSQKYYMIIEIPEDFSQKVTTVLDADPQVPELRYIQNEGLNFMAAQVTNSAVERLREQLGDKITATYARTVFSRFTDIETGFSTGADGSQQIYDGTTQLAEGTGTLLSSLTEKADDINKLAAGAQTADAGAGELLSAITGGAGDINKLADGSQQVASGASQLKTGSTQVLGGLTAVQSGSNQVLAGLGSARDGSTQVLDGLTSLKGGSNQVLGGLSQVRDGSGQVLGGLTSLEDGSGQVLTGLTSLEGGSGQVLTGLTSLQSGSNEVLNGINSAYNGSGELVNGIARLQPGATAVAAGVDGVAAATGQLKAGLDQVLQGLEGFLQTSPELAESPQVGGLVQGLKSVSEGLKDLNDKVTKELQPGAAQVAGGTQQLATGAQQLQTGLGQLSAGQSQAVAGVSQLVAGQTQAVTGVKQLVAGQTSAVSGVKQLVAGQTQAVGGIDQLVEGQTTAVSGVDQLVAGQTSLVGGLDQLVAGQTQAVGGLDQLVTGQKAAVAGIEALESGASQVAAGNGSLTGSWSKLGAGVSSLKDGLTQISSGNQTVATGWEAMTEGVTALNDGTQKLQAGSSELTTGLAGGAEEIGAIRVTDANIAMFSSPVTLAGEKVNGYTYYRDSTAPYVLSLALFVGMLVLSFFVDFKKPAILPSSAISWFVSKWLQLALFATIQAVLVSLFTLVVLRLDVQNVLLFILFSIFVSITFMSIVFFLVSVGGNIGRFIALAFIVLQLSITGSNLPIPMLPENLRALSQFLPLTYSNAGYKSIISLGDTSLLASNVMVLAIYLVATSALALIVFIVGYKTLTAKYKPEVEASV